ncbi:hypothetical protein EVAR_23628_1 [Eumeta japonica]|uniref:Uncharacterized protein n=1 Tax=Eumeta variegata TaxID=151549 RepID=A0A4C1VL16_EUMVA|nr:hypothetical protein EVAR_23628_1 [Eumeta japonica]
MIHKTRTEHVVTTRPSRRWLSQVTWAEAVLVPVIGFLNKWRLDAPASARPAGPADNAQVATLGLRAYMDGDDHLLSDDQHAGWIGEIPQSRRIRTLSSSFLSYVLITERGFRWVTPPPLHQPSSCSLDILVSQDADNALVTPQGLYVSMGGGIIITHFFRLNFFAFFIRPASPMTIGTAINIRTWGDGVQSSKRDYTHRQLLHRRDR